MQSMQMERKVLKKLIFIQSENPVGGLTGQQQISVIFRCKLTYWTTDI